jgi:hypothetical protein
LTACCGFGGDWDNCYIGVLAAIAAMRFLVQECTPSRSSNTGLDGITALRWPLRWNNRIEQTDFDQVKPVANGFGWQRVSP